MKVVIKDLKIEDAKKIALWKSDPILSRQLLSNYEKTDEKSAENWIERNSTDQNQSLQGIYYGDNASNALVGIVRLMFIDYESLTAELGIYVGDQSNRNLGIGGSALDLMLNIAFSEFKLEKVYLKVVSFNEPAISLYRKRKFSIEGVLRQHYFHDGTFHDVICMAIFRNAYL